MKGTDTHFFSEMLLFHSINHTIKKPRISRKVSKVKVWLWSGSQYTSVWETIICYNTHTYIFIHIWHKWDPTCVFTCSPCIAFWTGTHKTGIHRNMPTWCFDWCLWSCVRFGSTLAWRQGKKKWPRIQIAAHYTTSPEQMMCSLGILHPQTSSPAFLVCKGCHVNACIPYPASYSIVPVTHKELFYCLQ